jgi:hypothetical protein
MLWLGGFHALDLTTSTPDALCPPLEETRAAVKARVGEVRGEYQAEFALIRADDGQQALELVLRDRQAEVLRRELPLDGAGCDDAAQAIALVLERYFDAIEKGDPSAASKPENVPSTPAPSTSQPAPEVAPAAAPSPPARPQRAWRLRAGAVYDFELGPAASLGAALYPTAFRLSPRVRIGVALDAAQFLTRLTETVREEKISAITLRTAFSLPVSFELSRWSLSTGPWAELRFQRASAPTLPHGRSDYRAVPALGGFADAGWQLAQGWTLGAGFAFGAQFPSSAARFILLEDGARRNEVLVPHAWFAEAQLMLALSL